MRKLEFKRAQTPRIGTTQKQQLRADLEKILPAGTDIDEVVRSQLHKAANEILWLSADFQVNIDEKSRHLTVRHHDKSPITHRDDMVAIAAHFIKAKRMVPVELYPRDSKVIDTSNQYFIWPLSMKRHAVEHAVGACLENPNTVVALGDGYEGVLLDGQVERNWRDLQTLKNSMFGADREAFDLLLPATQGLGVLLMALPAGMTNPIGWQKGIRSDEFASRESSEPNPAA